MIVRPAPASLQIVFDGQKAILPAAERAKVDAYWQLRLKSNPTFFNGEVFTIIATDVTDAATVIHMAETDYAHHLYTLQVGDLGRYNTHTIHPSSLVISADDRLIFGKMGPLTGRPGVIACCGGGMDYDDVKDGEIDIKNTAVRELQEELGVDVNDSRQVTSFTAQLLIFNTQQNIFSLAYIAKLAITNRQFLQNYQQNVASQQPEFSELYCISRTPTAIEAFIAEHTANMSEELAPFLRKQIA